MDPKTTSATAMKAYELCSARYNAEKILYARGMQNDAALRGSVCHNAMERWVKEGYYLSGGTWTAMKAILIDEYFKLFTDLTDPAFEDCCEMMERWYNRQDWLDVKVISTESKETLPVHTTHTCEQHPDGVVPFTYIFDRLDEVTRYRDGEDGRQEQYTEIRIVDYKTVRAPKQPDDLRVDLQARAYGLAGQIKYPDKPGIWVVFDLLRYDTVGVYFSKEQNRATYGYLKSLTSQILEDDGKRETINPECNYCVRASACDALKAHVDVGGVLSYDNLDDAVAAYASAKMRLDGLKSVVDGLGTQVHTIMKQEELQTYDCEEHSVKVAITAKQTRKIDPIMLARIIGPEMMARYGTLGITTVEKKLLQDPELTDSQKSQIKGLITKQYGSPYLKVTPKKDV